MRAREQGATAKLFLDDLARLFDDAGEGQLSGDEKETKPPYVEIATRFIDDTVSVHEMRAGHPCISACG